MSNIPRSVISRELLPAGFAIYMVVGLSAFEGLAVSAALPQVAGDLGGVGLLPWVITAYLLSSGVATVIAGPLVDAYGVRATYRWAVLVFAFAGFAAGLSPTLSTMVVLRLVQGIGGEFLVAIALTAVGLVYPDHLIGRAYAASSVVWGVMGVAGPALAAGLLTFASWRWIFFINLPLGLLALVAGWRVMPSPVGDSSPRVDVRGALAIATIAAATVLGVDALDWRSSLWAGAAVASGLWYLRHARLAPNPVVRIEHIARQPFVGLAAGIGLVLAGAFTMYAYLPFFVRAGRGGSSALTAWSLLFFTVGWTSGAMIGSRMLDRRSESAMILVGFATIIPSMAVMAIGAGVNAPLWVVFAGSLGVGFGLGMATNAALTLLRASTSADQIGRASAAHQFARIQGFTVGAAIGGAVLLAVVGSRVGDVELVRDMLSGSAPATDVATKAVQLGFALSGSIGIVLELIGLGIVIRTRVWHSPAREARNASRQAVPGHGNSTD